MRLFAAIQLNHDINNALTATQNTLRENHVRGHYTDCQNLHLTLAFIGEFGNPDLVLDAMEQIEFEPFPLTLSGYIGNFGDLLWASVEKNNSLEKVARHLRHVLADGNIPFDKKRFNPHITLLRKAVFSNDAAFSISDVSIDKASMTVSSISLMRSDRGKHGMIYTEVGSIVAIQN